MALPGAGAALASPFFGDGGGWASLAPVAAGRGGLLARDGVAGPPALEWALLPPGESNGAGSAGLPSSAASSVLVFSGLGRRITLARCSLKPV